MKLKSKHLLPIILLLLVVFALVSKQKNSTLDKNDNLVFGGSIKANKIEISSVDKSFSLVKEKETWFTNDKNKANPKTINQLFKVLENIQIISPVLKEHQNECKQNLEQTGTNIKIYSDNKLLYNLKFSSLDNKSFVETEAGNIYYISIRGYSNSDLSKYTKNKVSDWYDKVLINLEPNEITGIMLEFNEKPQSGFRLKNESPEPHIFNSSNLVEENTNTESVKDYLHFFSGIQYSLIDTIQQIPNPNKQLFRLNINTNIDKKFHIVGFELVDKKTLKPDMTEFVGIINNSLMVKLKYSDFDPILVERDYFLKN